MRVYFYIMQKGELHLDDGGLEFNSLSDAYDFLFRTLIEAIREGNTALDVEGDDCVIDITDRGRTGNASFCLWPNYFRRSLRQGVRRRRSTKI
jgi:hypothetical protein